MSKNIQNVRELHESARNLLKMTGSYSRSIFLYMARSANLDGGYIAMM